MPKTRVMKLSLVAATVIMPFCVVPILAASAQTTGSCWETCNAVRRGEYDAAEAVLDKCQDLNARNEDGTSILMCVIGIKSKLPAHTDIQRRVVQKLIDRGADVHARNRLGQTPLMQADDPIIGEMLLKKGADVNAADVEGATALILQSKRHHSEAQQWVGDLLMIDFLLKNGLDVNARDKSGKTALTWAASYCNVPATRRLLKAGADVNARDKDGKTALFYCRRVPEQDREIYDGGKLEALLVQHGATEATANPD